MNWDIVLEWLRRVMFDDGHLFWICIVLLLFIIVNDMAGNA